MKKTGVDSPPPAASEPSFGPPTTGGDLAHPMPSEGGAWIRQKDGTLVRDGDEPVPSPEDDRVQMPLEAAVKEG
jgi:hypothetical protein